MVQYALLNESYEGLQGMAQYVNDTSGGILTPLLLLLIWFVIFIAQIGSSFQRALLSSSFIVSGIAVLMVVMNFLSPTWMYVSFILVGLSIVIVRLNFNE